jgi:hypothetical protein
VSDDVAFPVLPTDRLSAGGWTLADETVETVFEMPTARVVGATRLYDDDRTRAAAREAVGVDQQWRFFFATRLTFQPPLAPGIGAPMVLPTVRSEAVSAFADQLRDRGFSNVDRGRRERIRVDSGDRARLRSYSASVDLEEVGETLSVTGWVAVWHGDGFRIAAGAYPDDPVADVLGLADPPDVLCRTAREYRDDLLSLIRAVA